MIYQQMLRNIRSPRTIFPYHLSKNGTYSVGFSTATIPLGNPSTTVRPSFELRNSVVSIVVVRPSVTPVQFFFVAPYPPVKQSSLICVSVSFSGRVMVTLAFFMGISHPFPVTFQYSSSWSSKYPSSPFAVYEITYVCSPEIVVFGSPTFKTHCSPCLVLVTSYSLPFSSTTGSNLKSISYLFSLSYFVNGM